MPGERWDPVNRQPQLALGLRQVDLALAQCGLGALLVLDVIGHRIPANDIAIGVAKRRASDPMPSVLPVGAPQALLHLEAVPLRHGGAPPSFACLEIIRMNRSPPARAPRAGCR